MKPVLTKQDFVRRYRAGEFGNRSPTWPTVKKWCADPNGHGTTGWNGPRLFHLRNRNAGGATYYNLTTNELVSKIPRVEGDLSDYYVSEMAPHQYNLLQGEVRRGLGHLELFYSTAVGVPMREALQTGREATGTKAAELLRAVMCANSYDWLQYLLDTYEDHIVEFTTLSRFWGTAPRHNTIFWEVRMY